jgi:hypothetical protein
VARHRVERAVRLAIDERRLAPVLHRAGRSRSKAFPCQNWVCFFVYNCEQTLMQSPIDISRIVFVRIYANQNQYSTVFGSSTWKNFGDSILDLWYAHYNGDPRYVEGRRGGGVGFFFFFF